MPNHKVNYRHSLTVNIFHAMKKSFLLIPILILVHLNLASAQDGIIRFFDQYSEDERFTTVFISPKMFELIGKFETDDEEWNQMREVIKDLGGLRVLHADTIADGNLLYKDALKKVPENEYAELLTVRDGKENVRIWIKDSGKIITELLLLVGAPSEFTLLSFTGKIDLDKISTLSKGLGIDGSEHLEKIKQKNQSKH
jgi:Domain of unknown function (DUF4252)